MGNQVIAKYGPFVFRCCSFLVKEEKHWFVSYMDLFEDDDLDIFFKYYKKLYPNHSLQVFKHSRKNLTKQIRVEIESQIKHPYFLSLNRDFNLRKIVE